MTIWEDLLGVSAVGVHDNFFDLGGHSLLAVRLVAEIEKQFGKRLGLPTFFLAPTIEQVARTLLEEGKKTIRPSALIPLRSGGSKPPLFCICGLFYYRQLARHLNGDRPVYAILIPIEHEMLRADSSIVSSVRFPSVEEMAAQYVTEVRRAQPVGPYYLAGLSFGGVLAFEIAHQLQRQGETVELVALIDTVRHGAVRRLLLRWVHHRVKQLFRRGPHHAVEKLGKLSRIDGSLSRLLGPLRRTPDNGGRLDSTDAVIDEVRHRRGEIFKHANKNYVPSQYPGRLVLFRAMSRVRAGGYSVRSLLGWEDHELEVYDVPGDHLSMLQEPHVQILANKLQACLDEISAGH